jgi:hypothetical protein
MYDLQKHAIPTGVPNVSIVLDTDIKILKQLPEIPQNRVVEPRVDRMNKHFVKDVKSIHYFTVFHVAQDLLVIINGEEILVKEGWYIGDGNTRLLSNKQLNDSSHKNTKGYDPKHGVITKIVTINTSKQLLEEYYSIDNSAATEKNGDLIRGAMKMLGIDMTSPKGKTGTFGSAINNAYPGDRKDPILNKIAYFRKELMLLDKSGVFNTTEGELQNQHFYCACLMSAKMYSEPSDQRDRLVGLLKDISRTAFDQLKVSKNKWNGMTYIIYQSVLPNKHVKIYDDEFHKSTKFASWNPVVGFMLYCIDNHMNDKLISKKGIRPSTDPIAKGLSRTRSILETLFPIS